MILKLWFLEVFDLNLSFYLFPCLFVMFLEVLGSSFFLLVTPFIIFFMFLEVLGFKLLSVCSLVYLFVIDYLFLLPVHENILGQFPNNGAITTS